MNKYELHITGNSLEDTSPNILFGTLDMENDWLQISAVYIDNYKEDREAGNIKRSSLAIWQRSCKLHYIDLKCHTSADIIELLTPFTTGDRIPQFLEELDKAKEEVIIAEGTLRSFREIIDRYFPIDGKLKDPL